MVKLGKGASVVGLLTFGTITSLFSKIVYELPGIGLDGEEKYFRKPWAMTTLMFLGMSLCLPLAFLEADTADGPVEQDGGTEPLLQGASGNGHDGERQKPRSELREAAMLAIPTIFDLAATVLMNVGLLSVTASVYQMMRGAEMLFAAALAVAFLRRRLNRLHAGGIACCIAGIALVGVASTLAREGGTAVPVSQVQILTGMGLIILSQAVQAAQITFEDYFMSELSIPAMKIVGYEGLIGSLIMVFVMAPLVRLLPGEEGGGVHEDIVDTLHMVAHSRRLAVVLVVQMFALLAYNYMGMHVTGHLGAVFRTVLETMRTLFVWLLGLLLFYARTGLGERWTRYSFVQAAGFVVLVAGTVVYGRGDEREAQRVVAEIVAARAAQDLEGGAGEEEASETATLHAPRAHAVPISSVPLMVSASPSMRASRSMVGSYQDALASSLRDRGISSRSYGHR